MKHTAYCLYINNAILPIYGDRTEDNSYVLKQSGDRWILEGNGETFIKKGGNELGVYLANGSIAVIS